MTEGTGWIYKGFLLVEKPPGIVKAYRSPLLWDEEITSYVYESENRFDIERVIDSANDGGDFDPALGPPAMFFSLPAPKYSDRIMEKVRQKLGLEPGDTLRDKEINEMNRDTIFQYCLEWEGIIGYDGQIRGWIENIYGVNVSTFGI